MSVEWGGGGWLFGRLSCRLSPPLQDGTVLHGRRRGGPGLTHALPCGRGLVAARAPTAPRRYNGRWGVRPFRGRLPLCFGGGMPLCSRSTGRSGRQNAATRRNMRRGEWVTVQGPVKKQQPDGMSHGGGGGCRCVDDTDALAKERGCKPLPRGCARTFHVMCPPHPPSPSPPLPGAQQKPGHGAVEPAEDNPLGPPAQRPDPSMPPACQPHKTHALLQPAPGTSPCGCVTDSTGSL